MTLSAKVKQKEGILKEAKETLCNISPCKHFNYQCFLWSEDWWQFLNLHSATWFCHHGLTKVCLSYDPSSKIFSSFNSMVIFNILTQIITWTNFTAVTPGFFKLHMVMYLVTEPLSTLKRVHIAKHHTELSLEYYTAVGMLFLNGWIYLSSMRIGRSIKTKEQGAFSLTTYVFVSSFPVCLHDSP